MQQIDTYHLKTKKQAARYLNVSVASIERHMRSRLRFIRVGNLVRFRDEDLSAYLDQNARGGAAA